MPKREGEKKMFALLLSRERRKVTEATGEQRLRCSRRGQNGRLLAGCPSRNEVSEAYQHLLSLGVREKG
jgi:hypothetical protein